MIGVEPLKDHELVLECRNVCKSYGHEQILINVNLKMGTGGFGIVGPNGAGKTTLLEIIAGLRTSDKGIINIYGSPPEESKKRIGVVPDRPVFPENITSGEFLEMVAEMYGVKPDLELIRIGELHSILEKPIGELSAGYLKRLAFVIAAVHRPSFMIADEPFSNVDIRAVKSIQEMILRLKERGVAFLISSHDIHELLSVVDFVYLLRNGNLSKIEIDSADSVEISINASDNTKLREFLLESQVELVRNDRLVILRTSSLNQIIRILANYDGAILEFNCLNNKEKLVNDFIENPD